MFFIDHGSNKVYTWFTHFCRKLGFVAITRFLGGTFCSNLVLGGTKTFYRTGSNGYSCTNSKSRDSRRELSNSRRELSISLLEFRNSRLYPIYNSQKQTRITYFSVEKTIKKKLQFSSSAFLVYTRITFLLTREIYLKQFSKKCRTQFECRKRIECRTRLECPPGQTAGRPA